MFFLHFSIMLRQWFNYQDFIVAFNFFFNVWEILEIWQRSFCMLSWSWKSVIWLPFYLWRVSRKNDVDGQLLHAINAFYGADWSFVVEWMASNQSFPYRHWTTARMRFVCSLFIVYMNWIDICNQADEFATTGNWKISCLLSADDLLLLLQNLAFSAHHIG